METSNLIKNLLAQVQIPKDAPPLVNRQPAPIKVKYNQNVLLKVPPNYRRDGRVDHTEINQLLYPAVIKLKEVPTATVKVVVEQPPAQPPAQTIKPPKNVLDLLTATTVEDTDNDHTIAVSAQLKDLQEEVKHFVPVSVATKRKLPEPEQKEKQEPMPNEDEQKDVDLDDLSEEELERELERLKKQKTDFLDFL